MRPSVSKSKLFVLALLLAFLSSALPSLAAQKSAFMRVVDLKAGHSNRGEVNGNPINYYDPDGLEDIFIGNGSSSRKNLTTLDPAVARARFSHITNTFGFRERFSPSNIVSDLRETTDLFLVQSHHDGRGLWLEGGDLPLEELVSKVGQKNLPLITVFMGCNTATCPSAFDENGNKALLTFTRKLDVVEVSAFTGHFLEALSGGLTVKNARDSAISRIKRGNIIERNFASKLDGAIQIFGNENAKIKIRGLR